VNRSTLVHWLGVVVLFIGLVAWLPAQGLDLLEVVPDDGGAAVEQEVAPVGPEGTGTVGTYEKYVIDIDVSRFSPASRELFAGARRASREDLERLEEELAVDVETNEELSEDERSRRLQLVEMTMAKARDLAERQEWSEARVLLLMNVMTVKERRELLNECAATKLRAHDAEPIDYLGAAILLEAVEFNPALLKFFEDRLNEAVFMIVAGSAIEVLSVCVHGGGAFFEGGLMPWLRGVPDGAKSSLCSRVIAAGGDDLLGLVGSGGRLIPGTPGLVEGGSSKVLGRNLMEAMGLPRSTSAAGYEAHHIIPSAARSNEIIMKIGMQLDDATNGIFLPKGRELSVLSQHSGFHSTYNDAVLEALKNMDVNQSVEVLERAVFELQGKLRMLVMKGTPMYPTNGATLTLWRKLLAK